jgi:hypothetical protein
MRDLVLSRRQLLKGAGAVGVLGAVGVPSTVFADGIRVRWDIINVDFSTGTLSPGGIASAQANDGSKITLTGSGTFSTGGGTDGGGNWKTFNPAGEQTGSGTYRTRGLVTWVSAPGTPPLPHDNVGDREDQSAGLAVLRIRYSDDTGGLLTVSCHLNGTSDAVFEGITTTKGYLDYWNREAPPAPPGNANRTNFHLLTEDED